MKSYLIFGIVWGVISAGSAAEFLRCFILVGDTPSGCTQGALNLFFLVIGFPTVLAVFVAGITGLDYFAELATPWIIWLPLTLVITVAISFAVKFLRKIVKDIRRPQAKV